MIQRYLPHTLFIFAVFAVFLLNAIGIVEFPHGLEQQFHLRPDLLGDIFLGGVFPPPILGLDFITFVCTGVLLSVALPALDPVKASVLTFISMLPPFYVEYANPGNVFIVPMEFTLVMILVLFSVNVLIKYFVETREKQQLISVFGQYVPPEVADALSKMPHTSMEGEARELTVLFCDIRDFSAISEKLDPRQLAQLLNIYFTGLTDILHRHGATIDKYMGDAIMCFWGAPLVQEDHAVRALSAAREMLDEIKRINEIFAAQNLPAIDIGIGLNTGVMNVGNMGSKYRIAYTVVGDAVNLGARLEGLTRVYDTKIIVAEATKLANRDFVFRELDHVRVKGKGLPTRIYEPIAPQHETTSEQQGWLKRHEQALHAYYNSEWEEAEKLFAALNAEHALSRYYVVMRNRVMSLSARHDPHFDGITSFNAEMSIGGA